MDIFYGNRDSYFPPQFRYVGYVLVVAGAVMVYTNNLFGIGFILIGPLFFLLKTGIRINFGERTFQEYKAFAGLFFGKWEQFPEIEYVTVYKETESQEMNLQSVSSENIYTLYNTDLIFPEPNRLQVISFQDKASAMAAGRLLAGRLNTRLLDYTSDEPVWMDNFDEENGDDPAVIEEQ